MGGGPGVSALQLILFVRESYWGLTKGTIVLNLYMNICVHIYIYIYTHIFICIYIYIYVVCVFFLEIISCFSVLTLREAPTLKYDTEVVYGLYETRAYLSEHSRALFDFWHK